MSFRRIPSEIVEAIIQHLDLHDIKNLRLTNKAIADRCLGPHFLSYVSAAVETDLTERSLWNLDKRASHPAFRHTVRRLTIQAICYDHSGKHSMFFTREAVTLFHTIPFGRRWVPVANFDLEWLAKQQQARDALPDEFIIKTLVTALDLFLALDEIKLQTWIITEPGEERWKPYEFYRQLTFPWESHVCYLALAALTKSKSQLRAMDIFNPLKGSVPRERSGVPTRDLVVHLANISQNGYDNTRLPLESLKLSFSADTRKKPRDGQGSLSTAASFFKSFLFKSLDVPNEPNETRDCPGVVQLLQRTPNLQTLGLYFDHEPRSNPEEYRQIFTSMALKIQLPRLQICKFTELCVTVNSLLQFLNKHPNLTRLVMDGLSLPDGESWDTIFRFISNNMKDLQELCLAALYQGSHRLNLGVDCEAFFKQYYRKTFLNSGGEASTGWDIGVQFWKGNTETQGKDNF